jgi:hypothetical protein
MRENRRNILYFAIYTTQFFLELKCIYCFNKVVLKYLREDANWPLSEVDQIINKGFF